MAGLVEDESAVADVVGNFLLIAITVAMVAVLAFFIASQPPPDDPVTADLTVVGGVGEVLVEHRWGEDVALSGTRLLVNVNGGTDILDLDDPSVLDNSTLRNGKAEFWEIGEWVCVSCLYNTNDTIDRLGIASARKLVMDWQGEVIVGTAPGLGPFDPNADFTWSPKPAVEGEVTQFTDLSTDLDGSVVSWSWDFDDGSTSPDQNPAHTFTAAGDYLVTLTVTDDDGRTDSRTRTVTVQGLISYVTCPMTVLTGFPENCTNARQDDDVKANLTEEDTAGEQTRIYNASTVVNPGSWMNTNDVLELDGNFTTTNGQNNAFTIGFEDQTATSDDIQSVVMRAQVRIEGGGGSDGFGAKPCLTGTCEPESIATVPEGTTTTVEWDFTSNHPNGNATWTWADVNALEVEIISRKGGGGPPPSSWQMDHAWLVVTSKSDPAYQLEAEGLIEDIAGGTSHELQIRYENSADEAFTLEVWDWSGSGSWGTSFTLNSASLTDLNHTLASNEISSGNDVKVRFTDASGSDVTESVLRLAYVRVVTI